MYSPNSLTTQPLGFLLKTNIGNNITLLAVIVTATVHLIVEDVLVQHNTVLTPIASNVVLGRVEKNWHLVYVDDKVLISI